MRESVAVDSIVRRAFQRSPDRVQRVGGGMINQVYRIEVGDTVCCLKIKLDAPPGFFAAEAHGLKLLSRVPGLRVPHVIIAAGAADPLPGHLILEWIDHQPRSEQSDAALGARLAQLHQNTNARYGLERDNFIGALPQHNPWSDDWPGFYRDHRLLPQMRLARTQGLLNKARELRLQRVIDQLTDLLGGVERQPALLHGDLWGGNVLVDEAGQPVVIDPAAYYGDREIELAFTELFGGFSAAFYAAYDAVYPRARGYDERRALYQIYPLLVHVNLFGETYGPMLDAACQRYS